MRQIIITLFSLSLLGCASAPDVKLGYFLPKAVIKTTATQVITCKPITDELGSSGYSYTRETTFDITPIYSSDTSKTYWINPKKLGAWFTDSQFKMTYAQGGRISHIKGKVSGQGAEVVDLASDLMSFKLLNDSTFTVDSNTGIFKSCKIVDERIPGSLKQITVTFSHTYDDPSGAKLDESDLAEPKLKSTLIFLDDIEDLIDIPKIEIEGGSDITPVHLYTSKCKSDKNDETYRLCLSKNAEIALKQPKPFTFKLKADGKTVEETVYLPQHGTLFTLPLPRGTLFGVNDADISFNPDGTVSSITYNTTSDMDGISKAIDKVDGDSDSEKAAKEAELFKAQADAMYQAKRLQDCQNDPSNCKEK